MNHVSSVRVSPTPSDPAAGVTVNGGSPSSPVQLSVGANVIEVVVTAENGYKRTYTITVNRATAQARKDAETPPGPVQNLRLEIRGKDGDNLKVSWDASADGAATKYEVKLTRDGEQVGKTRRPGPKKENVIFRNLESGATYEASVRAKNDAGWGEWASAVVTLPEKAQDGQ